MKNSMQEFGVSRRIGYNSDGFYQRKMYASALDADSEVTPDNIVSADCINRIFHHSSEQMDELPDNSIHMMITSPPYNVGKEYDEDLSLHDFRAMLQRVWKETYRVLVDGGRVCINVANIGRKPYIPLHAMIIADMTEIGYLMRGEIIWNKGASAGASCAWGSWRSASNPVLRDIHEYILKPVSNGAAVNPPSIKRRFWTAPRASGHSRQNPPRVSVIRHPSRSNCQRGLSNCILSLMMSC